MHRRLRAVQEAVMTVVIMVVTMAGAVADRRRGLVAVLALGHAQLLRRLGAEFTCRARAIAARHFPRMRFATFVELRCSWPSTVVAFASGRADIPDTAVEKLGREVGREHLHRRSRGTNAGATTAGTRGTGGGGRDAAENRVT